MDMLRATGHTKEHVRVSKGRIGETQISFFAPKSCGLYKEPISAVHDKCAVPASRLTIRNEKISM